VGKKFILESTSISTDRPLNDIWKRIQNPHPFPSNLILGKREDFVLIMVKIIGLSSD